VLLFFCGVFFLFFVFISNGESTRFTVCGSITAQVSIFERDQYFQQRNDIFFFRILFYFHFRIYVMDRFELAI